MKKDLRYTLRALARLLAYPDAGLRGQLAALGEVLHAEGALSSARLSELDALVRTLAAADPLEAESGYVELFDRGQRTSLHLFEHVHGDSRDRGPAMIDLHGVYAQAGLRLAEGELPDYLPAVLEFASTQPPAGAREFLGELAHIVNALCSALVERQSPYAAVFAAILELAGERVKPVPIAPEPPLDESWSEPPAFDGCSSASRASGAGHGAGAAQPVRIVRNVTSRNGAAS